MGIKGLLSQLKPFTKSNVNIEDYRGQTIGVDGHIWLYRGAYNCAYEMANNIETMGYIKYFMKQINVLIQYGIKPYIVFDGCILPIKMNTEQKRDKLRKNAFKLGI